ncbi:unnamed protein product [Ilex paraguariensis]|uniref:Uncharacterized protein n=1 Tax=Ilex paraguariensis TaxID=185542 RepID=A0ABC8TRD6_9AQUA
MQDQMKKKNNTVERQCGAIRAIRDVEVEQLQTWLRLLRSHFTEEQLQIPVLKFFKENLPNLAVLSNGKDGHYEVQWRDKYGIFMDQADGRNIHSSLLHRMSMVHPDCSATLPSFSGLEFSSKAVKTSLLGAENPQIGDFALEEPSNSLMCGLQNAFQTPGLQANSQRLSVGAYLKKTTWKLESEED